MTSSSPTRNNIIIFSVTFFSVAFLVMGYFAYPIFSGDSDFYIPTAINIINGRGLTNEFTVLANLLGPSMNYQTPLFPIVLSFLSPINTAQGISLAIAMLHAFSLIIFGCVLTCLRGPEKRASVLADILAVSAGAAVLISYHGRPDSLTAIFFLLLGFFNYLMYSKRTLRSAVEEYEQNTISSSQLDAVQIKLDTSPDGISKPDQAYSMRLMHIVIVNAFFLGLIALNHPYHAVIASVLLAVFYSYAIHRSTKLASVLIVSAVSAGVVFLLGLTFFFGDPFSAVSRIMKHGSLIAYTNFHIVKNLFWYAVSNPMTPFFGPSSLIGFLFAVRIGIQRKIFHKKISAILICIAFVFIFLYPMTAHISYAYSILLGLICVYYYFFTRSRPAARWAIACLLFIMSLGLLRQIILFPFYLRDGLQFSRALSLAGPYSQHKKPIGVTSSLFSLDADHPTFYQVLGDYSNIKPGYFFYQQYASGNLASPSTINNCMRVADYFSRKRPTIAGVQIAASIPGYGFAVYLCRK